jgi:hypothetical protein
MSTEDDSTDLPEEHLSIRIPDDGKAYMVISVDVFSEWERSLEKIANPPVVYNTDQLKMANTVISEQRKEASALLTKMWNYIHG